MPWDVPAEKLSFASQIHAMRAEYDVRQSLGDNASRNPH